MNNYKQSGDDVKAAAPYAVASGAGALIGSLFGVAVDTYANAALGVFRTHGVYQLAKATGQAWTVGLKLYWDNTAKNVTSTVGTNVLIGCATAAAASGDTTGLVRLNGTVV